MSWKVQESFCDVVLEEHKVVARVLLMSVMQRLAKVVEIVVVHFGFLSWDTIIETRCGVISNNLWFAVLPNDEGGGHLSTGQEFRVSLSTSALAGYPDPDPRVFVHQFPYSEP